MGVWTSTWSFWLPNRSDCKIVLDYYRVNRLCALMDSERQEDRSSYSAQSCPMFVLLTSLWRSGCQCHCSRFPRQHYQVKIVKKNSIAAMKNFQIVAEPWSDNDVPILHKGFTVEIGISETVIFSFKLLIRVTFFLVCLKCLAHLNFNFRMWNTWTLKPLRNLQDRSRSDPVTA